VLWAVREYNWQPVDEAAEGLRYYGRLFEHVALNTDSIHAFFGCLEDLLRECWQLEGRSQAEKGELASWICQNVVHPRWYEMGQARMRRHFLDRMLLVLLGMPVAGARRFAIWLREHFSQEGVPAAVFADALGDLVTDLVKKPRTRAEKERVIANFLGRLPVCLQRMVPDRAMRKVAGELGAREGTLAVLEAHTPVGDFSLAHDDIALLAEDKVERQGVEAVEADLTVRVSVAPARYAFCEEVNGVPQWPSYPIGAEVGLSVDAVELLDSWAEQVRKITADAITDRIAVSRTSLASRLERLRRGGEWNKEKIDELRTIAHSPAIRLMSYGRNLANEWLGEFIGASWEAIQRSYCHFASAARGDVTVIGPSASDRYSPSGAPSPPPFVGSARLNAHGQWDTCSEGYAILMIHSSSGRFWRPCLSRRPWGRSWGRGRPRRSALRCRRGAPCFAVRARDTRDTPLS